MGKRQKMAQTVPAMVLQPKKPKEKRVKKRKTVRARRKRKETTKFSCLLSPHLVIISALRKKGQKEIDCVSSKSTPIQTREMPDQFPTVHKTTEHPLTKRKKSIPRDGV